MTQLNSDIGEKRDKKSIKGPVCWIWGDLLAERGCIIHKCGYITVWVRCLYLQREQVLFHWGRQVKQPCFYRSQEWTNQAGSAACRQARPDQIFNCTYVFLLWILSSGAMIAICQRFTVSASLLDFPLITPLCVFSCALKAFTSVCKVSFHCPWSGAADWASLSSASQHSWNS